MNMRSSTRHARVLAGAAALALAAAACGGDGDTGAATAESNGTAAAGEEDWPDRITYAVVPGEGDEGLEEGYGGIIQALEEDLGIEIEFVTATDIAGVIEALISGSADMAHMGPFGYVIARNQGADVEPIGATIRGPDMEPDNKSLGFTLAGNDEIDSIEDLVGKEVCFTDPGSTTGYLYPAGEMLSLGIDPESDMTTVFTGQHDAAVLSVLNGDCDAGFSFLGMVTEIMPAEGSLDLDDLKLFYEQEVESGGVYVSTQLPGSLQEALSERVLALNGDVIYERGLCGEVWVEEEGPSGAPSCRMDHAGSWGYYPVDDEYYDTLRMVCEETQAPACDA
jgi:phosphonate transport system substrate-binding protein